MTHGATGWCGEWTRSAGVAAGALPPWMVRPIGTILLLLLMLSAAPAAAQPIPDHKDVVAAARTQYANMTGRQRAYCTLNAAAWKLRAEGFGLFFKQGTSSFADRSSDILMRQSGRETFDVLEDAEGRAEPRWERTRPTGFGNLANWRAPVDPATSSCAARPPVIPPVIPPTVDELRAQIGMLRNDLTIAAARIEVLERERNVLQERFDKVRCTGSFYGLRASCTVIKE